MDWKVLMLVRWMDGRGDDTGGEERDWIGLEDWKEIILVVVEIYDLDDMGSI